VPSLSVLGVGSLLALRRAMRLAPPQCLLLSIVIAVSIIGVIISLHMVIISLHMNY
jgi:hypothetical protein